MEEMELNRESWISLTEPKDVPDWYSANDPYQQVIQFEVATNVASGEITSLERMYNRKS